MEKKRESSKNYLATLWLSALLGFSGLNRAYLGKYLKFGFFVTLLVLFLLIQFGAVNFNNSELSKNLYLIIIGVALSMAVHGVFDFLRVLGEDFKDSKKLNVIGGLNKHLKFQKIYAICLSVVYSCAVGLGWIAYIIMLYLSGFYLDFL